MNFSKNRRKIFFYGCYVLGAALFFIFVRFPGDTIRDWVEENSQQLYPGVELKIAEPARLGPLLGIIFTDCAFSYQDHEVLSVNNLKIRFSVWSLLGDPAVSFRMGLSEGIVRGRYKRTKEGTVGVEAEFFDLRLGMIRLPDHLSGYSLAGTGAGDFTLELEAGHMAGRLALGLKEGRVGLAASVFGLKEVDFDTVEAVLIVETGKVRLERLQITGRQVTGEFSGNIIVREPYSDTVLNISGFVTPRSSLIKKMGEDFPVELFIKNTTEKKGLPVRITGTAAQPEFSMQE